MYKIIKTYAHVISIHHIYLETHINMLRSQTSTPSFAWKDTLGATSSRWHLVWSFEHVQRRPSTRMDMAKVGGPLSVVKVCTSMLCTKIVYWL